MGGVLDIVRGYSKKETYREAAGCNKKVMYSYCLQEECNKLGLYTQEGYSKQALCSLRQSKVCNIGGWCMVGVLNSLV